MKHGIRDIGSAFGSKASVLLVGLAIQSSLAWFLGPEGRGAYAVCLLFATLLSVVFALGIEMAGRYFVGSGRFTKPEALWSTLTSLLICSALAVAAGRVFMETDLGFFQKADRSSFMVALALIPFYVLSQGAIQLLVGLGRIPWVAITAVTRIVVQFVAVVVFVRVLQMGVNGALLAVLMAAAAALVVASIDLVRLGAFSKVRLRLSQFRDLLSYGLRSYVVGISGILSIRLGTMVLAFFVAADQIGLFAAGSGLVAQVVLIPESVETALFARVAGQGDGRPETVSQAARVTAVVVGACLVVLAVLAKVIVAVLFSPRFMGTVPLIWIMAIGVFVHSATKVLAPYFMGTDRPAVCSWAMGLGMAVNLIALVVLVPAVGLVGAAWAMTAGFIAGGLVLVLAFRRVSGMGFGETWRPRRADLAATRAVVADVRAKLTRS